MSDVQPFTDPDEARTYLNSVSGHPFRIGDTSYLHPDLAVKYANAIQQARAAGLPATFSSGYRAPAELLNQGDRSNAAYYDAAGNSGHSYGFAGDVGGIGTVGSPGAQQWAKIADQNGLYNPYGANNPAEYNHWQSVPWKLEDRPDVMAKIKASGGNLNTIWNAVSLVTNTKPLAQKDIDALWGGPTTPSAGGGAQTPQAQQTPAMGQSDIDALYEGPAPKATVAASTPGDGHGQIPPIPTGHGVENAPSNVFTGSVSMPSLDPRTWSQSNTGMAGAKAAAGNALDYASGQIADIPGAVSDAYHGASALTALSNQQLAAGNVLPSMPSTDPRTWSMGGAMNALGGAVGQLASPFTGFVRQVVQDPSTQMTGSPEIGERAGFVANTIGAPFALRGVNAAAGGVANAIGDATIGSLDPETARLAQLSQSKYGIPVTAPQMAGDTSVLKIGSNALDRLPFSGAGATRDAQMEPWHRGLAAEIGEPDATYLTPNVMSSARTRIGGMFDTVAKNTTLQVDGQFAQDIHKVVNDATATLTEPEARIIRNQVANIYDKIDPQTGHIDGETYQALTKHNAPLNSLMNSDNPNISNAARGIDSALDDVLARSAAPEYQDMLSTARRQWAALKTIEPLAAKASTPGHISPALLSGRVNAQTGNGMAYGWGGNLGELAQIGRRFLMEPGSSNTAERGIAYAALGALGGDAYRAAVGGMGPGEAAYTLAGIPAGIAAARGVNAAAKSSWLSNALVNRSMQPYAAPAANGLSLPVALGVGGASLLNKPVNALGPPNP